MFNDGHYWERARQGEFTQVLRRNSHPAKPKAKEPICTRSQIVSYMNRRGKRIANVHQYLRVDGTIGLKGRPDPKALLVRGALYMVVEPFKD
jgi:hypothetical protein